MRNIAQPPSASLTSSDPANQTGSLASSTNSIAGSSSSPGAKLNDSDSGSSLDTGGSAQKTSTPVAAIVGGVLGALLAIALLALVLLYCHRKRARSAAAAYLDDPSTAAAPSKSRCTCLLPCLLKNTPAVGLSLIIYLLLQGRRARCLHLSVLGGDRTRRRRPPI